MTFDEGSFIEPLACVVRAQRFAEVGIGQTVLVIGSGISGLLHIQLARALGAARIIATDISDYRLKAALRFGADLDTAAVGEAVGLSAESARRAIGRALERLRLLIKEADHE